MKPGEYRLVDYWRMVLYLGVLVIAVSVPMIIWVRPFLWMKLDDAGVAGMTVFRSGGA